MKQRPILFSTPMVQAILDGRKTMTRRIVKHKITYEAGKPGRTDLGAFGILDKNGNYIEAEEGMPASLLDGFCPYEPGSILWVREKFRQYHPVDENGYTDFNTTRIDFFADPHEELPMVDANGFRMENKNGSEKFIPWKPSLFMPRSACRIFLQIESVRVERLQEISGEDCLREGIIKDKNLVRVDFMKLWQSINGPDSWEANPWVWAITFNKF